MPSARRETTLIAELNDLLQLDHDAVQGYTIAIDRLQDTALREPIVAFRADHKRHIEELAALVRDRGGLPLELPHPTGALKLAVQALGAVGNDVSVLLAFKTVEGQVRDKYRRAAARNHPGDVAEIVKRAAADEERHYGWVESALRGLGAGSGTLKHGVASALEQVHKLLADPIERVEREVTRRVGEVVGSARGTGGGEASIPAGSQPFIAALRALEEDYDLDRIVSVFDDSAEISNPTHDVPRRGREGAREFWRAYRDSFEVIRSDFSRVVEADGAAMLEWTSHGRILGGRPIDYSGVSVLELQDGKVHRFRTYFDTKAFIESARAD
jgi:ketosteroid isomerase-like protein/rubrerythrin